MSKTSFLKGAVVLGIAGLIIKFLGAFFRIPLANIIGSEGMGYYQSAYPIYVLFLTLATAGLPTAISRMVAERSAVGNYAEAHRVFRISFVLLMSIGIVTSAVLFFGAEVIVGFMVDADSDKPIDITGAMMSMKAIAPALLLVPMMAAYRGYFQGQQNMGPTAASQVIEQFFRVAAGLSLAVVLMKSGVKYAAAGAASGAAVGAAFGLIGIMLVYLANRKAIRKRISRSRSGKKESAQAILAKILIIAIPITIGASIMPIMNTLDIAIVIRRLMAMGYDYKMANDLYGELSGMAAPLINFPQVLTQAIAMSLVPAVATAYSTKDLRFMRHNVSLGLRSAIIIGLPCSLGLMVLAEPIMLTIYPNQAASAVNAAGSLFILAFGVIFLSTVQTLTGVLQGIGKQMIPVRNLLIGAVAKVGITYYLTGLPEYNIKGAAIGTVTAYIIASTLNLMAVRKYTGTQFDMSLTIIKPLIAGLTMALCAWGSHRLLLGFLAGDSDGSWFPNAMSTLIAIGLAAVVYCIMIFAVKAITKEEIRMLPKGQKLVKILEKFERK